MTTTRTPQVQREHDLIEQLKASTRIIELLVEVYMAPRKLTRVEALQVQTCKNDNDAYAGAS